ncbi:hypothetical protein D3C79_885310 [compost metagenome]
MQIGWRFLLAVRGLRIDQRIAAHGFQQSAYRRSRAANLFQNAQGMRKIAEFGNRKLVQHTPPTVDVIGAVQGSQTFRQGLAVHVGVVEATPLP